jgi:hypothetical protein
LAEQEVWLRALETDSNRSKFSPEQLSAMLKQRFAFMSKFFTRERFGRPQFLAALLLLAFLAQCVWLTSRAAKVPNADPNEDRILGGLQLWQGRPGYPGYQLAPGELSPEFNEKLSISHNDPHHSAMYYLIASAPFRVWPGTISTASSLWGWLARAPFIVLGVLLGASVWYVARRLYGNAGGFIGLELYAFAPGMIRSSAIWFAHPETGAAWGAFGAIFTAIAVAHTLYAPREVVLWNWRRILLLGLSLALAIGSQFSLIVLVPVVLLFMLYVAPTRRLAALAIWAAACAIAAFLLFASYFLRASAFVGAVEHASFAAFVWQSFGMPGAYVQLISQFGQLCPVLFIAIPAALVAYIAWPRTRYFGNTAPLLVAALFLILGLATPHYPGLGFRVLALPFLFLFIAGTAADLLETRQRQLALACVWGLLGAYAIWSTMELIRASAT